MSVPRGSRNIHRRELGRPQIFPAAFIAFEASVIVHVLLTSLLAPTCNTYQPIIAIVVMAMFSHVLAPSRSLPRAASVARTALEIASVPAIVVTGVVKGCTVSVAQILPAVLFMLIVVLMGRKTGA